MASPANVTKAKTVACVAPIEISASAAYRTPMSRWLRHQSRAALNDGSVPAMNWLPTAEIVAAPPHTTIGRTTVSDPIASRARSPGSSRRSQIRSTRNARYARP